jgi:prepilin-type N-terminal cleavage/methylation domain-containing protein
LYRFAMTEKPPSNEEGIIDVKSSSGAHDFRRKTGLAAGLNRLGLSSRGADQSTGKNWPADGPGFTLTEVLVVVAILAVLAAISFATISSMRTKADQMNTIGQMRHLAQATLGYAGEHGGQLPGHIPEPWDVEVLRYCLEWAQIKNQPIMPRYCKALGTKSSGRIPVLTPTAPH